jgi:hypothetical protein
MLDAYTGFFTANVGASAAFIGLLFVALSFINTAQVEEATRAWRRIIANSSFSQLVNIFFVSVAGLLPDARNFALMCCAMGVLGLAVAIRLLPQTTAWEKTGRSTPTVLGLVATGAYLLELVAGIGLLRNPASQTWLSCVILVVIVLYAGALARAWEITGFKHQR